MPWLLDKFIQRSWSSSQLLKPSSPPCPNWQMHCVFSSLHDQTPWSSRKPKAPWEIRIITHFDGDVESLWSLSSLNLFQWFHSIFTSESEHKRPNAFEINVELHLITPRCQKMTFYVSDVIGFRTLKSFFQAQCRFLYISACLTEILGEPLYKNVNTFNLIPVSIFDFGIMSSQKNDMWKCIMDLYVVVL